MDIIQNIGQCDLNFLFYSINSNYSIYFTNSKINIITAKEKINSSIKFINSRSDVDIEGINKTNHIIQHITKDNIKTCFSEIPTYEKIIYKNLWKSIDLEITVLENKLVLQYLIHPGGDINNIKFKYDGSNDFSKDLIVISELYL